MKIFFALFLVLVIILTQTGEIFADEMPQFTSCINPQGNVQASYDSGVHGIVGNSGTFEGKDVVYTVSSNAQTQCFCASDGSGIQTNWVKVSGFSESEIKVLESQGWIYIPNGALWGLTNAPYLALNSDFSCKSSGGSAGGSGAGTTGSSSSSSSSSNSGSGSGGSVLGSATGGIGQVLGLASTGNTVFVIGTALTSGISLLTGLIFKKRIRKYSK